MTDPSIGSGAQHPELTVAYLVNLYPKISHSFIRREIQALESLGVCVHRYAIRRTDEPLVDNADREELAKTKVLLDLGAATLLGSLIRVAVRHPIRFWHTLGLAIRAGVGSDRGLARHLIYFVEAGALFDLLRHAPVDHLDAHSGTNAAAVAMYCAALGGPGYSFTAHGTESFESPARVRLGLKAKRARFAVAVCEVGRSELIAASIGIDESKVHVVRCGLDELFRAEPPSQRVAGNQLTLVGRLSPEKGHRVLLEAANRLHRDGVDFRIVLVGHGDVQTGRRHGRRGVRELVVDSDTGWLVPPGDPEGLAEAMKQALRISDEELTAKGARARERVLRMHDVRREVEKLTKLFERYADKQS